MHTYSLPLLRKLISSINVTDAEADLRIAEALMTRDGFWSGPGTQDVVKQADSARARLDLAQAQDDLDLYAEALADPELSAAAKNEIQGISDRLDIHFSACERGMAPAIVTVSAGAGGEDARDFATMTVRELCAYAENRGLSVEVLDETVEGSGLRDCTLRVSGPDAFRILRGEAGKRRLVRQSPFGAGGRQTSFCGVTVLPESKAGTLDIPASDLRIETYRDTGPGGQHRNTTDSAVRITHIPSGLSAKSALRSQHENKRLAMLTLIARIEAFRETEQRAEMENLREGGGDTGFGGHVRTLVLDPYRLVRNEISGQSSTDVEAYLSGEGFDVRAPFAILKI